MSVYSRRWDAEPNRTDVGRPWTGLAIYSRGDTLLVMSSPITVTTVVTRAVVEKDEAL